MGAIGPSISPSRSRTQASPHISGSPTTTLPAIVLSSSLAL